jgi:hypothetical protein
MNQSLAEMPMPVAEDEPGALVGSSFPLLGVLALGHVVINANQVHGAPRWRRGKLKIR